MIITRTAHLGLAIDRMKECFAWVLHGALASTIPPERTPGSILDTPSRAALWGSCVREFCNTEFHAIWHQTPLAAGIVI
eukprot:jgi/Chlat1/623/Chrsp103S01038